MAAAVVTGAASGIGRAIATALIAEGWHVLLTDIHTERLQKTVADLGDNAIGLQGDIAAPDMAKTLADKAFSAFGAVDMVFANAGLGINAPLLDATPDQFDLTFGVNTKAAWLTVQAFARHWVENGLMGKICITGSEHSLGFQHAGNGLYTASKHAVLGLADVLRHELPERISVSVLCPGLVNTGIYDVSHIPGTHDLPPQSKAFGAAVMARGMDPAEVARRAIDGTRRGDFLIVTHDASHPPTVKRAQEVADAFATQAPKGSDAADYDVTSVMKSVRAAYRSGQK